MWVNTVRCWQRQCACAKLILVILILFINCSGSASKPEIKQLVPGLPGTRFCIIAPLRIRGGAVRGAAWGAGPKTSDGRAILTHAEGGGSEAKKMKFEDWRDVVVAAALKNDTEQMTQSIAALLSRACVGTQAALDEKYISTQSLLTCQRCWSFLLRPSENNLKKVSNIVAKSVGFTRGLTVGDG